VVSGDFFEAVPEGGDAYVLKRVIHDWDGDRSVQILARCRDGLAGGGCVLTIDGVTKARNEPDPIKDMDLFVGMAMTGGRERTEEEFARLYRRAGLRVTQLVQTPSPSTLTIVEGAATRRSGLDSGSDPRPSATALPPEPPWLSSAECRPLQR
jgi:hypothetical protein